MNAPVSEMPSNGLLGLFALACRMGMCLQS